MSKLFSTPSLTSGSDQEALRQSVNTLYQLSAELTQAFNETEDKAAQELKQSAETIGKTLTEAVEQLNGRIKKALTEAKAYSDGNLANAKAYSDGNLVTAKDYAESLFPLEEAKTLTLQNGWVAYSNTVVEPSYYKDQFGIVHLQGMMKGGTNTMYTIPAVLPEGYRPAKIERIVASFGIGTGIIQIYPNGNILIMTAGASEISLSSITFRAQEA